MGPGKLSNGSNDFSVRSIGGKAIGSAGFVNGDVIGSGVTGRALNSEIGSGSGSIGGAVLGKDGDRGQLRPLGGAEVPRDGDKWGGSGIDGSGIFNSNRNFPLGGAGIWGADSHAEQSQLGSVGPTGGGIGAKQAHGVIGGGSALGAIGSQGHSNGSSALASMLGINLPTGSGSLSETTTMWQGQGMPAGAPLSGTVPGVIGSGSKPPSASIGGVPIGNTRPVLNQSSQIIGNNNNNSDIALLQSLLPGVHITSGTPQQPSMNTTSNFRSNWDGNGQRVNGSNLSLGHETWGRGSLGNASVGGSVIGQVASQQRNQNNIW